MFGAFMVFLMVAIAVLCGVSVILFFQKKEIKRDEESLQEKINWNVDDLKESRLRHKARRKIKRSKQKNFEDPTTMD